MLARRAWKRLCRRKRALASRNSSALRPAIEKINHGRHGGDVDHVRLEGSSVVSEPVTTRESYIKIRRSFGDLRWLLLPIERRLQKRRAHCANPPGRCPALSFRCTASRFRCATGYVDCKPEKPGRNRQGHRVSSLEGKVNRKTRQLLIPLTSITIGWSTFQIATC
jgi:hypothetical protein